MSKFIKKQGLLINATGCLQNGVIYEIDDKIADYLVSIDQGILVENPTNFIKAEIEILVPELEENSKKTKSK